MQIVGGIDAVDVSTNNFVAKKGEKQVSRLHQRERGNRASIGSQLERMLRVLVTFERKSWTQGRAELQETL